MELPRLSVRALAAGLVVMLALDLVLGFVLLVVWPGETKTSADIGAIAADPAYLAVAFILGAMTTAIGGAVCARQAPTLPYWHSATFGVLSIIAGLLLSDSTQPWWFTAMATLVSIPAAVYGARLGLVRAGG